MNSDIQILRVPATTSSCGIFRVRKHCGALQELLEGLDDLRLLGNDAAHIESQEFNNIGKEEVEIGIQFAKEVLKAVFQYGDLLAKLRSLKKTP